MATAYSDEVSIGTYNRIRIRCDYSGTSATCTVQFRRTQAYSSYWGDSTAKLTFNGTTKNAGYSYSGTVGTSWVDLVTVSGYSVSTSGGTYNWSFSNPGGGVLGCSGSISISSQGTTPTGLAISLIDANWNSVTAETTIGDWGSGTGWKRQLLLLESAYVAGADKYRAESSDNTTRPVKMAVGAQSSFEFSSPPFVVYGCKQYYTGLWAHTTVGDTRLQGPTFYTAPHKLDSLTYSSETYSNEKVAVTIAAKTNSTWNKTGATVGFLYQVSSDGGETFDGWKTLATTATVGTTANLTIPDLDPGTAYVVEVAQICMEADLQYNSESSFVNFTTKKYRKTYGPGASGYVTSTFTDDAKHTVENTADHTLLGYSLLGKTEQGNYSGAQRLTQNGMSSPTTDTIFWNSTSGTNITSLSDGWCKIEGTSAQFDNFMLKNTAIDGIAVGKTYTFIFEFRNVNGLDHFVLTQWRSGECFDSFQIVSYPDGRTGSVTSLENFTDGVYVLKNTVARDGTVSLRMFTGVDAGKSMEMRLTVLDGDHSSDWQNYYGDKWQPYTGGYTSPSPDCPQTVKTATGRQTVTIIDDNGGEQSYEINLGKNLFNYATDTTGKYIDSSGTIQSNGGFQLSDYIAVEPGEWYSYRGAAPTTTWGAKFGFFNSKKVWVGAHDIHNGMYTFMVPNGVYYMRLSVTNATIKSFQFEKGESPSSYSPYFTPIELNKLDPYVDKIQRSNGKWYVHKEMGKHTFNGSETWTQATASNSGRRFSSQVTGIKSGPQGTFNTVGYSTHFLRSNGDTYGNYGISGSTGANVYVRDTKFDSMDGTGVKTWFTSNPTDIWYVLATATDTEITYAPLVKQLETLYRLGHTSVDATTFDRNGYGNATVGLEVKTANSSSLPVGYTPLEYIQNTTNDYFNLTGLSLTGDDDVVMDCEITGSEYDWTTLWCCRNDYLVNTNTSFYNTTNGTQFRCDYGTTNPTINLPSALSGRHVFANLHGNFYLDGELKYTRARASFQGPTTTTLLASNINGSGLGNYGRMKLYSFKVRRQVAMPYDVINLVPCKSIDNKIGLFDTVNRKFYPSANSAFTAGPVASTLVTKQFRKLYGAKPSGKNLIDLPLNFTVASSNRYKDVPVALTANKTYTLSVQDFITDGATDFLVSTWNGSTEVGSGTRLTATNKTFTFTRTGDVNMVRFYSSNNWADSGSHTTTFHGVMIEEGDKATTYQMYTEKGDEGKLKKIKKLYGPAPAQTNLIHIGPLTQVDSSQTSNGITTTKKRLTCEEVNMHGTVSSNWANFGPQYSVNWPAGTYTLTIDRPLPFQVYLRLTGGAGDKFIGIGSTSSTFTTTTTTTAYYFFATTMTSGKYYNETFKIQLVKGSTPDYDFKLYSDGTNANTTKLIYND